MPEGDNTTKIIEVGSPFSVLDSNRVIYDIKVGQGNALKSGWKINSGSVVYVRGNDLNFFNRISFSHNGSNLGLVDYSNADGKGGYVVFKVPDFSTLVPKGALLEIGFIDIQNPDNSRYLSRKFRFGLSDREDKAAEEKAQQQEGSADAKGLNNALENAQTPDLIKNVTEATIDGIVSGLRGSGKVAKSESKPPKLSGNDPLNKAQEDDFDIDNHEELEGVEVAQGNAEISSGPQTSTAQIASETISEGGTVTAENSRTISQGGTVSLGNSQNISQSGTAEINTRGTISSGSTVSGSATVSEVGTAKATGKLTEQSATTNIGSSGTISQSGTSEIKSDVRGGTSKEAQAQTIAGSQTGSAGGQKSEQVPSVQSVSVGAPQASSTQPNGSQELTEESNIETSTGAPGSGAGVNVNADVSQEDNKIPTQAGFGGVSKPPTRSFQGNINQGSTFTAGSSWTVGGSTGPGSPVSAKPPVSSAPSSSNVPVTAPAGSSTSTNESESNLLPQESLADASQEKKSPVPQNSDSEPADPVQTQKNDSGPVAEPRAQGPESVDGIGRLPRSIPQNLSQLANAADAIASVIPNAEKYRPLINSLKGHGLVSGKGNDILQKSLELGKEGALIAGLGKTALGLDSVGRFVKPPSSTALNSETGSSISEIGETDLNIQSPGSIEVDQSHEITRNMERLAKMTHLATEIAKLTGRDDIAAILEQLQGVIDPEALKNADPGMIRNMAGNMAGNFASRAAQLGLKGRIGGLSDKGLAGGSAALGGVVAGAIQGERGLDLAKNALSWYILHIAFGALWTGLYSIPAIIYLDIHYVLSGHGIKWFTGLTFTQKAQIWVANFIIFFGTLIIIMVFFIAACTSPATYLILKSSGAGDICTFIDGNSFGIGAKLRDSVGPGTKTYTYSGPLAIGQWQEDIAAAAQKANIDACILQTVISKESRSDPEAIGCDCLGTSRGLCSVSGSVGLSKFGFNKSNPPDYNLNWNSCSYGIGLTQWTIYPKNSTQDYKKWCNEGPSRLLYGICYSVPELLVPQVSLGLTAEKFRRELNANRGDLQAAFMSYNGSGPMAERYAADAMEIYKKNCTGSVN